MDTRWLNRMDADRRRAFVKANRSRAAKISAECGISPAAAIDVLAKADILGVSRDGLTKMLDDVARHSDAHRTAPRPAALKYHNDTLVLALSEGRSRRMACPFYRDEAMVDMKDGGLTWTEQMLLHAAVSTVGLGRRQAATISLSLLGTASPNVLAAVSSRLDALHDRLAGVGGTWYRRGVATDLGGILRGSAAKGFSETPATAAMAAAQVEEFPAGLFPSPWPCLSAWLWRTAWLRRRNPSKYEGTMASATAARILSDELLGGYADALSVVVGTEVRRLVAAGVLKDGVVLADGRVEELELS